MIDHFSLHDYYYYYKIKDKKILELHLRRFRARYDKDLFEHIEREINTI